MKTSQQLADRFREVLLNGTFIANTNYKDQLEKLPLEIAQQQLDNLNTIALLVQHVHYYFKGVSAVFRGGALEIKDAYSFDFPPFNSEKDWETFLKDFFQDAETFASLVEKLSEEKLHAFFFDKKYGTYHRNIEGMIEHCYYHLGQIVLIKKLLNNNQLPKAINNN